MAEIPGIVGQPGVVYLLDWWVRDGEQYIAVYGSMTVHKDEQLLGFKTRGGHNWAVKVTGESGRSIYFLGCQIRAIELGVQRASRIGTWRVP